MIVVVGYDTANEDFIVHDPGTKEGANFRYSKLRMQESLRDYPSGRYAPIPLDADAAMIVVKKPNRT